MIVGERKDNRLADMRHRVRVERKTETVDESRQRVVTYVQRFESVPAKFEQVSGGELVRGRQIEAGVIALFTVNFQEQYQVTDRIVFQGENYGIHRINKPNGVGRFLELHCKAAPVGQ